ncbi:MAG TPA: hypothetical protein DGG95_12665 [Cytophagales bacterium]|nr:hypothetical protein [Cytophagales bacterium]
MRHLHQERLVYRLKSAFKTEADHMDQSNLSSYLDLFDKNCETKPDAVAVKFGNSLLTYSDLYKKSNHLANFLVKKGLTSEILIGVSAERSLETIVSLLAIHRIGAAYVPLDLSCPVDRLKDMIEDSGLLLILSGRRNHFLSLTSKVETIDVTRVVSTLETEKANCSFSEARPDSLAYVIYTSGSTGHPKGVMVTHANLLAFVKLVPKALPVFDEDIYLQSASIAYAVSVRQIFTALSHGLKLVIASSSDVQNPIEFFRLIRDEKVTLVDFVPSHWRSCIAALKSLSEQERVELLRNKLRRIVTIGEPLLPDLPVEWREQLHHPAQVVNIFGQTETTGIITSFDIPEAQLDGSKVVSIGRPIPETQVYILNSESLEKVPDGETGELCVSNACVAKGYLNNPNLTAAKFQPNPFDNNGGRKLYRTGDFARYSSDGSIEYLGRSDQQVKIRGMRVELGEIEAVIIKNANIREVVVVPQTRANYRKVLVAFLTTTQEQKKIDVTELKRFLRANLPPHMIPINFVVLPEMPRNSNGKISRKELMEYRIPQKERDLKCRASLTSYEEKLLAIWKRLLKINSIQATDHFFDDLGGDSFLALLLFIEIEKEFGRTIAISTLYTAPTIEKMASLIASRDAKCEFHSLVPIKPSGTGCALFLVHGAGGNVLIYRDLSKHLSNHRPIYGLQSCGLEDRKQQLLSIEEMAKAYLHDIKRIQPLGPYLLCGYCMGGTIALEVAQQLKRLGDEVAFLAMLETYDWSKLPPRSIFDKSRFLGEKILFHWKNLRLLSNDGMKYFLANKSSELKNRTKIWALQVLSAVGKNGHAKNSSLARQSEIWKQNDKACFRYQASFYDGRLTVFLTKKKYSVHRFPEATWNQNHAKEIDMLILPFYPAGMLVEPFVRKLAKHIDAKIDKALSRC